MGPRRKVVVVGIGGASCSGKTLLAKHIRNVLPSGAIIVHQDDFAPPIDQVPYAPRYPELQDWDDPPTCILWPKCRETLKHVRETGTLPDDHQSHDHLNKQVEVDVDRDTLQYARQAFERVEEEQEQQGFEVVWIIVDGFVLYWDPEVVDMLDVKVFLRVPSDLLKRRREERQTYALQDGTVWTDPPHYFEQIVQPAYIKAHEHLFKDGDVESGEVKQDWQEKGLAVLSPLEGSGEMSRCFENTCRVIVNACQQALHAVCEVADTVADAVVVIIKTQLLP